MAKRKTKKQNEEKSYLINFEKLESEGFSSEFLLLEKLKSVGVKVKESENLEQLLTICSKFKKNPYDFILPDLSLLESIFRVILIRKNTHTTMNQIQSDLSEVWLEHYKLPYKNLSDIGIKSILEKSGTFISS
tara:strand:- start:170 stop:568 length:399 start_codon:yes stop_codon:yes gene_type:complete